MGGERRGVEGSVGEGKAWEGGRGRKGQDGMERREGGNS